MDVPFSTIDWLNRPPMVEDISNEEENNIDPEPQVWKDFEETSERFRKNGLVFYGKSPASSSERLSLPVTELCVSTFNNLNLDGLETKLNRLDVGRAAELTRNTCASPCSLVLALLYLERLRSSNPQYLNSISSADLFLVSLLVASKYLNDDGEEDEVFNDEWAVSGNLEKKELNRMELDFLSAIDWKIYVSQQAYESTAEQLEYVVALKEVEKRKNGSTTYAELTVLSNALNLAQLWQVFYEYTLKVTAVCALTYAAALVSLAGTIAAFNHTCSELAILSRSNDTNVSNNLWRTETTKVSDRPEEILSEHQDSLEDLINERMRFNETALRNSSYEEGPEDLTTHNCQTWYYPTFPNHQFTGENAMVNRISRSILALKLGTFRDLMLGPHHHVGSLSP